MKADVLVTNANSYPVDCVFILRESVSPKNLVPGLQMDGNHVAVNLQMETNVPGCFACGDIAGRPYQYIKSAGQGKYCGAVCRFLSGPEASQPKIRRRMILRLQNFKTEISIGIS